MNLKEMTVKDVSARGLKKLISEMTSVKFWAAIFVGYLNYHIIIEKHEFDIFGMFSFLALLGIREAADFLQKKNP